MRVEGLEALDEAAENISRGLRIVLDLRAIQTKKASLAEIKSALKPGKGEVRFTLPLWERGREMEFALPGRYDVSPNQAGLISSVYGVAEVVEI